MGQRFEPALKSLLNLASASNAIVRVAAMRAVKEVLRGDAGSHLSSNCAWLLDDPQVTSDLWLPEQNKALKLAKQFPTRATILEDLSHKQLTSVTKDFLRAAAPDLDREHSDRYDRAGAGNDAVKRIANLRSKFDPQVRELFLIYVALFKQATTERFELVDRGNTSTTTALPMPDVVPTFLGALTTSWQLAWAASRKPIHEVLEQLGPKLKSNSGKLRWAAAQFLEEVAKYQDVKDSPLFGGGTGPRQGGSDIIKVGGGTGNVIKIGKVGCGTGSIIKIGKVGRGAVNVILPPPQPQPAAAAEPAASHPFSEPPRRYADITFQRDNKNRPGERIRNRTMLQTKKWYWLEVAIRCKPIGLRAKKPEKPIRPVRQKGPIDLLVTVDSEDFEFEPDLGRIKLPPLGDSTEQAFFRVRHKGLQGVSTMRSHLDVRIFYRLNLLEFFRVHTKVGTQEQIQAKRALYKEQQTISRQYLDFDDFVPRTMNVHIVPEGGIYSFEFTLSDERAQQQVVLRARSKLDNPTLEDKLTRLRKILQELSLTHYVSNVEGSDGIFRDAIRILADFGRELWLSLFSKASGPGLDLVGKALKDRPLAKGGLIQISMPDISDGRFIYPWAFLFDRPLPEENYKLPDVEGFWGYRYAIEQHLSANVADMDAPVQSEGKTQMGFMLWKEFPNSNDQLQLMQDLNSQSQKMIEVSDPPITSKEACYELLRKGANPILYFFTHGHCRRRQTSTERSDPAAFVHAYMTQFAPGSEERKKLQALAARISEKANELDKSYIELSQGRLYYYDLLDKVEELSSQPFVFLNMCESAEILPFLQENFVSLFLDLKARAVLGTECPMTVNFAHPFSKIFLWEVFRGEPLAHALRTARQQFLDRKNPLGLAYTLYGSGTLRFLPSRLPTDSNQQKKLTT